MAQDAEKLRAQGERLRELKKQARGLTFRQIADAVAVTERQAQRWFAGESEISGDNLRALAKFMGTTPDYIEYGVVHRPRVDATPNLLDQLAAPDVLLERLQHIEEGAAERGKRLAKLEQRLGRIEKAIRDLTESIAHVYDVTESWAAAGVLELINAAHEDAEPEAQRGRRPAA